MGRPEQGKLSLVAGLQATYASATSSLMEIIKRVDAEECPKRSALIEEAGIKSESHLSEMLNHKGKNFPVSLLPIYRRYDSADRIANEIARWRGGKVVPLRPRSVGERLARLERVLDGMGSTGDFIREQAGALPDTEETP